MDNYAYIMDSISVGHKTQYANNSLTEVEAKELLNKTVKRLGLKDQSPKRNTNKCYGNKRYFAYIAEFPLLHVGIDNGAGTTRKFSITTEEELNKIPV